MPRRKTAALILTTLARAEIDDSHVTIRNLRNFRYHADDAPRRRYLVNERAGRFDDAANFSIRIRQVTE